MMLVQVCVNWGVSLGYYIWVKTVTELEWSLVYYTGFESVFELWLSWDLKLG